MIVLPPAIDEEYIWQVSGSLVDSSQRAVPHGVL